MKTNGLVLDPVSQESFFASPRLQVAVIEMELLLGLWLLSGWAKRAVWGCALGVFSLLAGASLYLGLIGQTTCNCFGAVPVNPWITFLLDIGIIAALVLCRPSAISTDFRVSRFPLGLKIILGAAALFLLIGGIFIAVVNDPVVALARLRGEPIAIWPMVSDVGMGKVGEAHTFEVKLANYTEQPVRILGGTNSCSCVATDDLPLTVPAGASRSLKVQFAFKGGRTLSAFLCSVHG